MGKNMAWRMAAGWVIAASVASAAPMILNEYNAVGGTKFVGDKDTTKSDSYFGRIAGNGGNWFELVVTMDHTDARGWTLNWKEALKEGTITLSDNSFWSNLRAGTILTFTSMPTSATGGKSTDTTIDYASDWWVNICTSQEQALYDATNSSWLARSLYTKGTATDGSTTGQFTTSNDDWKLNIANASGAVVMDWTGEGVYASAGVSSTEVFKLQTDPSASILPTNANYSDGSSSTFGAPNAWNTGGVPFSQDFSALQAVVPEPMTMTLLMLGAVAAIRRKK